MEITSVGYNFKHNRDFVLERPDGLNDMLFLIIRSPALFCINGEKIHLSQDSMIFISKNTPHSFYADGDIFINDWVSVNFDEHENSFICEGIRFNTFFNSPDIQFCSQIIQYMQCENTSQNPTKHNTMQNFFNIILNKLRNNSQYNPNKRYYNELKCMRDEIYSQPCKKYNIKELSVKTRLSKSYFHRLYKSYFGVSPLSDVINSRTEYAKQLLVSTDYSVSKISEILGYATDMQFIKQFKSVTKTTPNKYRNIITR